MRRRKRSTRLSSQRARRMTQPIKATTSLDARLRCKQQQQQLSRPPPRRRRHQRYGIIRVPKEHHTTWTKCNATALQHHPQQLSRPNPFPTTDPTREAPTRPLTQEQERLIEQAQEDLRGAGRGNAGFRSTRSTQPRNPDRRPFTTSRGRGNNNNGSSGGQKRATAHHGFNAWQRELNQVRWCDEDEGGEFYDALPGPWRVQPFSVPGRSKDYMDLIRTGGCLIFDGNRHTYAAWRTLFIQAVHRSNTQLIFKYQALFGALQGDARKLLEGVTGDKYGYATIIRRLEEYYGEVGEM